MFRHGAALDVDGMRGAVLGPCSGAAVRSPDHQRGLRRAGTASGVGGDECVGGSVCRA